MPPDIAQHAASLPPVSTVFSAFLGINPVQTLLGPSGVLDRLPAHNREVLTGKEFFPHLISAPFHHGLVIVFATAAGMGLLAATASLLRGGRSSEHPPRADRSDAAGPAGPAVERSTRGR